ncbi:MAG: nucleotide-binding protein [Methanomicrobiales archaeon]|nr:nucleotide-binding protein [Methanomicrobiales archaeon]
MIPILDSSVFFSDFPVELPAYTTHSVVAELIDLRSKCRYEVFLASGLIVKQPDPGYLGRVHEAAGRTGDASVLSTTDFDLLSLALELGGTIITDDFAVQNVARKLGITTMPIHQRSARARVWKFRCSGCGRYYPKTGECPVCGSLIKRKLK